MEGLMLLLEMCQAGDPIAESTEFEVVFSLPGA